MALTFDEHPAAVLPLNAVDTAKLQDEIHRLSQRLLRAQESYEQDRHDADAEVPLDVQLSVIANYTARLESLNEQLYGPATGAQAADVFEQPSQLEAPIVYEAAPQQAQVPQPAAPFQAPPVHRASPVGPGITNADGTPLAIDGVLIRTEEAALGEYVRHAAEERWLATRGRSLIDETTICDVILAALAHKHGVDLQDERQSLTRQVDARYRRDYG